MLLTPPTDNIAEVLTAAGLSKTESKGKTADSIREMFEENGAGIEAAARNIGSLMRNFDDPGVQLRACELALKVQRVFADIDEKSAPVVNITISGQGNQTLINLLTPAAL